eukprot:371731-Prorocentrum_minimum.AAC.4
MVVVTDTRDWERTTKATTRLRIRSAHHDLEMVRETRQVYSESKRQFEREAALFAPPPAAASGSGKEKD